MVFRAYDIRGIYGRDIDEDFAEKLGLAFGKYVGGSIVVGWDGRKSSQPLSKALVDGLTMAGCTVHIMGLTPTPSVYYGIRKIGADGGVIVTASHNPPEWNGFKLCGRDARVVCMGRGLEKVRELFYSSIKPEGGGRVLDAGWLKEDYVNYLRSLFPSEVRARFVVDVGCGAASAIAGRLFSGFEARLINNRVDPEFRCRSPEPSPEELSDLKMEVLNGNADFGVAYDGDADRSVFVDDRGESVSGDVVLCIYAGEMLRSNPGGIVVYEVSCSMVVPRIVKSMGGTPLESRVGHAYIMDLMIEMKALLGGEISSHFYFGDVGLFSDAFYATLKMALIVSRSGGLSSLVNLVPKYYSTPAISIPVDDEIKFKVIDYTSEILGEMGIELNRIDGVKAVFDEGWLLVRASNTKPEVKVRAEATTRTGLKRMITLIRGILQDAIKRASNDRSKS